jgi:hypothetical protein
MRKWVVVCALGLAVVVAGGATAASLVTSGDIKNGTIKKKDLSAKAQRQLKGNEGPRGPAGPTVVNQLRRVEASKTVAAGDVDSATATCPGGYGVITGGYLSASADGEIFINDSFDSPNSWSVGLDNFDSPIEGDLVAVAYCAPSGQAVAASDGRIRERVEAAVDAQRENHAR